jgi:hypothetical protein
MDAMNNPWNRVVSGWSRHRFIIGLAVVLVFSAAVRLYQIDGFSGDYDEGVHLMVAWLLARGASLYTEVMTVELPLLFQPTAWLFALLGPSSIAARCLEVSYALLGIAAIAWAGRLLGRPATGLVAALFLSLEMRYFVHSRMFVGSVAAAAVGALAMLGALYFQATGRRRWLLLAGASLSFSLLIKPISLSVGLLLAWVIIARRRSEMPAMAAGRQVLVSFPWRAALLDCLYLAAAGLILPILCFAVYDGPAMLRQVISVQSTRSSGRGLSYLWALLDKNYAQYNLPVLLLAAWGTIQTIRRRSSLGVTVILWLVLNFVFVVVTKAQRHHLVLLDLPLALLAAQAVGELGNLTRIRRLRPIPWSGLAAGLLLINYLVTLPTFLTTDFSMPPRGPAWPQDNERWAAVRLLQQVTTPDQFIISDDQELVFEARRTALPALVDTSNVVIQSDFLTEQRIMQLADQQASAFIFWTDRLNTFPMLSVWTPWAYAKSKDFGERRIIYYDKQSPQIAHPLNLTFAGEIALTGYELSPGVPPQATLYWRRLSTQVGDYKVTLRVLDAAGNMVAQRDYLPYGDNFATSTWPIDVLLTEKVALPSVNALPPGRYSLVLGLYDPDKLELLPVAGGPGQNNLALLEELTLKGR